MIASLGYATVPTARAPLLKARGGRSRVKTNSVMGGKDTG